MRRTLSLVALLLALPAAALPACLLDSSSFKDPGAGGQAGSGPTGPTTGTGGAAGMGGAAGAGGEMSTCGDGNLDKPDEQCDDGDKIGGDGCTGCMIDVGWACMGAPSTCMPTCGDGDQDLGEQCDDGGVMTGDGCNQGCLLEVGWECDTPPGMKSACHLSCGDATLDPNEDCDIGKKNGDGTSGCDAACKAVEGWTCEQPGGMKDKPSQCSPTCGDGVVVDGHEKCDDGNTDPGDGCNDKCDAIEMGWECKVAGMACTPVCGDGRVVGGEACDDGQPAPKDGDGCSAKCELESTCGNGIVEPGEQCDSKTGGAYCDSKCKLMGTTVCSGTMVISPGDVDMGTGVRTSYFEGNSSGSTLMPADLAPQNCPGATPSVPVLHRYTTGDRPSIVTIEALSMLSDNKTGTFPKTLIWVYRDCPNKSDVEGCDDNGAGGSRSRFTTGYLPAGTTIFIVLSGEGGGGGMDSGKYRLQVTEQPVKLFYYQPFPDQVSPGVSDQLGDLTTMDLGGTDKFAWKACTPGNASCGVPVKSHSGGAYAFGEDGNNNQLTNGGLQSDVIATPGAATKHFLQFDMRITSAGGPGDFLKVETAAGSGILLQLGFYSNLDAERREVLSPAKSDNFRFRFVFNDASQDVSSFSIDDIYVYGY